MLSKKNQNQDSVTRLRDLLTQLKTARHDSDDLAMQARHEVGRAIRGSGLGPVSGAVSVPARKKRAATKKAGRKKR
jgi:hypothetical protein